LITRNEHQPTLAYENGYKYRRNPYEKVDGFNVPIDNNDGENPQKKEEFYGEGEKEVFFIENLFYKKFFDDLSK